MNTKVIILNGPPSCGKDDAAYYICDSFWDVFKREFKQKLIELTCCIWDVPSHVWEYMYTRELKETKTSLLGGMSPREALIHTSETVIKPNYGADYFGVSAARKLIGGSINIFSDGGFLSELKPVIDAVGEDNVVVIRIHRPGFDFSGDSRNYLPDGCVPKMYDVVNDGTLEEYFKKIREVVVNEFAPDPSM